MHTTIDALNQHDMMVWHRIKYRTYRKARDIIRQAEYLERHGYRNHPTLAAVKASASARARTHRASQSQPLTCPE